MSGSDTGIRRRFFHTEVAKKVQCHLDEATWGGRAEFELVVLARKLVPGGESEAARRSYCSSRTFAT